MRRPSRQELIEAAARCYPPYARAAIIRAIEKVLALQDETEHTQTWIAGQTPAALDNIPSESLTPAVTVPVDIVLTSDGMPDARPAVVSLGRVLHYVMPDGTCRVMELARIWGPEMVNGVVTLDGENDTRAYTGTRPISGYHMWVSSVHQNENERIADTWHWPCGR